MRKLLLLVIAIVVVLSIGLGGYPHKRDATLAIIGGAEIQPNYVPSGFASLVFAEDYYLKDIGTFPRRQRMGCGGALVHPFWVLTANHCIEAFKTLYPNAKVGVHFSAEDTTHDGGLFDEGEVYRAVEIVPHPTYLPTGHRYDFALLRLEAPPPFVPFKLDSGGERLGQAHIIGYGSTVACEADGDCQASYPKSIRHAVVELIDDAECKRRFNVLPIVGASLALDSYSMFCAQGLAEITDTCQGDSGGPIYRDKFFLWRDTFSWLPRPELLGIVSWGYGCGDGRAPGVYADVAVVGDWIVQTIGGNYD